MRALAILGLSYYKPKVNRSVPCAKRCESFWLRHEHELHEILHDAWQAWRRLMQKVHPDRGGDARACARLNAVWQRVKTLFARKGITLNA